MTLKILLGDASTNHLEACVNQAKQWLNEDEKHEVFFIVPNNIKFEMETEFLKAYQANEYKNQAVASLRMQTMSLSRLAWYMASKENIELPEHLSPAGVQMITRHILNEHKEQLTSFRREMSTPSFTETLSQTLIELHQGGFTLDDLKVFEEQQPTQELKNRYHDLSIVYPQFLSYIKDFDLDQCGMMNRLNDILSIKDLSHICFIFYGFHHFSAFEWPTIEKMMEKSQVILSLVSTQKEEVLDNQLFYSPDETKKQAIAIAKKVKTTYSVEKLPFINIPDWKSVMNFYWIREYGSSVVEREEIPKRSFRIADQTLPGIDGFKADSMQSEVEGVARRITKWIKEGRYRFQDITVIIRGISDYAEIIAPIFESYQIPYNLAVAQKMSQHPLMELLSLLLQYKNYPSNQDLFFKILRTELLVPSYVYQSEAEGMSEAQMAHRQTIDLAEKFFKASGYLGYEWYLRLEDDETFKPLENRSPMQQDIETEEEKIQRLCAEEIRQFIIPLLESWREIFEVSEKTTSVLERIYEWLIQNGVLTVLKAWQAQDIHNNQLEAASQHEQTWATFIHLLDEYQLTLGDKAFDEDTFQDVLESGIQSATYSQVPSTLDQVNIVDAVRLRGMQTKVAFVMGASENYMPMMSETKSLLNDEERTWFNQTYKEDGKYLAPERMIRLNNEAYYAYLAMTYPAEYLCLSYAAYGNEGQMILPSPYIQGMTEYGFFMKTYHTIPNYYSFDESYISTPSQTLAVLLSIYRQAVNQKDTQNIHQVWQALRTYFEQNEDLEPQYHYLFNSLQAKNIPSLLYGKDAMQLYKGDLEQKILPTSVSKIENFYRCQYRHFLQYGLSLKEEMDYEMTPFVKGNLYHETLDQVMRRLKSEKATLMELDAHDKDIIVKETLHGLMSLPKYRLLHQKGYMEYLKEDIQKQLDEVIEALVHLTHPYGEKTSFQLHTEMKYNGHELAPLSLSLKDDWKMEVKGSIDRLDILDNHEYVLLDYKTHPKSMNYDDIYYGLALQLLTYIDVVKHNEQTLLKSKEAQEEMINDVKSLTFGMAGFLGLQPNTKAESKKLDMDVFYKVNGLYHDEKYKSMMSGKKKETISESDLDQMIDHVESKYKEAGNQILSGHLAINPYRHGNAVGCDHCPFKSICQFDPLLEENNYESFETNQLTLTEFKELLDITKKER